MWPFAVVDAQPGIRQRPEFGDRLEEMGIEDLGAIAAIEAFDVCVLIGLAGLDVVDRHAVLGAPVDKGLGGEFGAV